MIIEVKKWKSDKTNCIKEINKIFKDQKLMS